MVAELSRNMAAMQISMVAMQATVAVLVQSFQPAAMAPPVLPTAPPPPALPSAAPSTQQAIFPYGIPQSSVTGVPLHPMQWSSSPSPILSWALGSTSAPNYTAATSPMPSAAISSVVPSAPTSGVLYGASDGAMYYRGASSSSASASFGGGSYGAPAPGASNGAHATPKFYKLEFLPMMALLIL